MLDRAVRYIAVRSLAPAGRLSQPYPVRRVVTGTAESLWIHERFQKVQRVPIETLPVLGDAHGHAAQNVGGEMFHLDPGQNQVTRVISKKANITPPRCRTPADVAIARSQMPRGTRPGEAGNRSRSSPDQILQLLPDRLLIAQIMMLLQQTVKQRPNSRSSPAIGVVSISSGVGRALLASGLCRTYFTGGSAISPARSSIRSRLRQTMSLKAPFACRHCQASQSFFESVRRLASGWAAIVSRIDKRWASVMTRPRYLSSAILSVSMHRFFLERKGQPVLGTFSNLVH